MTDENLKKKTTALTQMQEELEFAFATGQRDLILEALEKYDQAKDQYEEALVASGFCPPWPPRTQSGLAKYRMTQKEVQDLVNRPNGRHTF